MKVIKSAIRVICPYCGRRAELVMGKTLPKDEANENSFFRNPEVHVWRCPNCKAMTIANQYTHKPVGELADAKLRRSRYMLHKKFDILWGEKKLGRTMLYHILAIKMKIPQHKCHFSQFTQEQCDLASKKIDEMIKNNEEY